MDKEDFVEMMSKMMVDSCGQAAMKEKKRNKGRQPLAPAHHFIIFLGTYQRMCGLVGVDVVMWHADGGKQG